MSATKDILKEFIGMTEEIISDQVKLLDYSFFKKYMNVSLRAAVLSGAGINEDEEMKDLKLQVKELALYLKGNLIKAKNELDDVKIIEVVPEEIKPEIKIISS